MTPAQFRQDAYNAFDWRDRPALEQAIRSFTDPNLVLMTRERLQERRALLLRQLAAVNEHLARHDRAHNAQRLADTAQQSRPCLDAPE